MKIFYVFALVPLLAATGCASAPKVPAGYAGRILTQVPAEQMAACLGQAASVAPSQTGTGLVVDVPSAQPERRYDISRDKVQTVVTIIGPYAAGTSATDQAAIACARPPVKAVP
ncbi:hypothetical protein O6V14_18840 [Sphingomonas faeni]|uniref:hypothetical protein n=1 Tax=Sphingomonas faeni TaxID=185950 RepID=UPI00334F943F